MYYASCVALYVRILALWMLSIKSNIKNVRKFNTITSTLSLQNNILPLAL